MNPRAYLNQGKCQIKIAKVQDLISPTRQEGIMAIANQETLFQPQKTMARTCIKTNKVDYQKIFTEAMIIYKEE